MSRNWLRITLPVLVASLVATYYFWQAGRMAPQVPVALSAPAQVVVPQATPTAKHYQIKFPPNQTVSPLPALDASDAMVGDALLRPV